MANFQDNFMKLVATFCISVSLLSHNGIITVNAAKKFSSILIFGDSLVDTGNNNYIMTFTRANKAPYGSSMPNKVATGRFSDGRLMGDLLAEALGIKQFVPPFLQPNLSPEDIKTGVCFASAGSGYDDLTVQTTRAIPVSTQINNFKMYVEKLKQAAGAEGAQNILANTLVYAVAGSNDYMLNYYIMPQRKSLGSTGFANLLHQTIIVMVKTLYQAGVRNMLIAGIPPFPDATVYNQKLKQQVLPSLQQSLPGSKIVYADLATPMSTLTVSGPQYGITMTTMPCCQGMPCMGMACPNPKQYLKFDSVHYTEAAYTVMAKYLLATAIPQFG